MTALDTFFKIADHFGVPCAILAALVWLAARLIDGPVATLAKAGVDYMAAVAGQTSAIPPHVTIEAQKVSATVEREGAATREHVSDEVRALRDRVSTAENEMTRAVVSHRGDSGQIPPLTATPPLGMPSTRPALPTRPEAT